MNIAHRPTDHERGRRSDCRDDAVRARRRSRPGSRARRLAHRHAAAGAHARNAVRRSRPADQGTRNQEPRAGTQEPPGRPRPDGLARRPRGAQQPGAGFAVHELVTTEVVRRLGQPGHFGQDRGRVYRPGRDRERSIEVSPPIVSRNGKRFWSATWSTKSANRSSRSSKRR